ncbi:DUF2092 domain-containing protein [Cyanothece sp. BG0011]|uniref:DUF2092 domain-containing protein n=1 Tax=Cyanothece sp. BG0011 TaxID=2082950 RepID=UPI000D1DC10F|nr:DUF2092 domain-containing protein [Cyanothece sp. BG0011]
MSSLWKKSLLFSLVSVSLLAIPQRITAQTKSEIEPQAIALIKSMSDRLTATDSMTFTAVSTYESPSRLGPPLIYTTISEVTVQRPNQLKVITPGDGPANEFYYDGQTITAYSPAENLVAVADAPATLDAALKLAYDSAAIYFPFTDVIVSNPYQDIREGLQIAFVVGQSSVVGGTTTDIVAVANDSIFAQIWIGAEDKLPRMIRAVYRDDPSRLRHQVEFSDWQLDIPVSAGDFTSSEAKKATTIPFAPPEPPNSTSTDTTSPTQSE